MMPTLFILLALFHGAPYDEPRLPYPVAPPEVERPRVRDPALWRWRGLGAGWARTGRA